MNIETLTPTITRIIENQVSNNSKGENDNIKVFNALNILLNEEFEKYNFNDTKKELFEIENKLDLQKLLSKINEKESGQKESGRFYTPKDVTEYIVANAFVNITDELVDKVYATENCISKILKNKANLGKILFEYTVFDPTCGTGEFLISALELKIELYKKSNLKKTDEGYLEILKTIFGNDINKTSIELSKVRVFFILIPLISDYENLTEIATILNSNYYNQDFIESNNLFSNEFNFQKFNIIVGNPPYVEDRNIENKPQIKYGNVYGNVLDFSAKLLDKEGVMGFILPLSYIATSRMKKLRDLVNYYCPKQFLLNYADRPDCLFTGVHQKLTILLCSNQNSKSEIFTSGYNYWYKEERQDLLSDTSLIKCDYNNFSFIPKIANNIEKSIFDKIIANETDNSFINLNKPTETGNLHLNMRACFWIKAFSKKQQSNEYKSFYYDIERQPYMLCLLNSSLFFYFWIVVSDCWHITNKELSLFNVKLNAVDLDKFKNTGSKLRASTGRNQAIYRHKTNRICL